jgi:hypothetical protein
MKGETMQPTLPSSLKPPLSTKETVIAPVLLLEEQLASARASATEALLDERRCIDAALQKIGYDAGSVPTQKGKVIVRRTVRGTPSLLAGTRP